MKYPPQPALHHGIRGLLLAGLVATISARTAAQDALFSQYTAAAVYNNPALAGLYDGDFRFTANYREQWADRQLRTPIRSYAATAEGRYDLGGRDYFVGALNLLHDSGGPADFSTAQIGLGLSGQKYLAGGRGRDATYLGFGARVGYGQHQLDDRGLWFSSQFDTTSVSLVESGSPLPASFVGNTRGYLDASTGVSLTVVKQRYSVWGGLAAHHVNRPNVSFLYNAEVTLAPRFSGVVGAEWLHSEELRILPLVTVDVQGQSRRLTAGAATYYKPRLSDDVGFRLGAYGRTGSDQIGGHALESLVFLGQLELSQLRIGISYDVNVGRVARATDGRGAYELSVGYIPVSRRRHKVVCPKI